MNQIPQPERLQGRVALVTGAASGIGRAIAERFVAEGARVVFSDLDGDAARAAAAPYGERAIGLAGDVTDEDQVEALCAQTVNHFGGLDVAVANAGRGHFGLLLDHDVAAWRSLLDLCVTGVFLTIKHAGRVMNDAGSIITIASLNALQPSAGMGAYCTAKAGVAMLTQVAAMELGSRGIRVNAIAPGLVATRASAPMMTIPGVTEEFLDNTTLGRYAQPEEVAGLAAYLASDESSFMTASLIPIDGGARTGRYPDLPAAIARLEAPR